MAKPQKATTPSKGAQRAVDTAWGANKGTTSPKEALAKKYTRNAIKP